MLSLHNSDYKASCAFVKWLEFDELYGCEEGASSPSEMNSYLLVCSQQKVSSPHLSLKTTNWIFLKFRTGYGPKVYLNILILVKSKQL